jgi:sialic acid synthase SpsE
LACKITRQRNKIKKMKLEETKTMMDLDKFIETLPAKVGKPMLKLVIQRGILISSSALSQKMAQGFGELAFNAYCDGKIGTGEELRVRYQKWLQTMMPKQAPFSKS